MTSTDSAGCLPVHSGHTTGTVDTVDTVEQLRAELARSQQQVADLAAAQEEFLRAVSHDLRAPLRHVTSYGTLVREVLGDLAPEVLQTAEVQEALDFLATMDQSARRMGLMLDGLLALVHASRAPLRLEPVSLVGTVNEVRDALAPAEAGRSVEWLVSHDLPVLMADPDGLRELLTQLLGNAIKFTGHTAQARVAVLPDAAPPGAVAFLVQDNGAGFDAARAGTLFGVFQRLHRETEFDGVGTGLALCRSIAERHGGTVTATAVLGGGCTVRVQWPVAPC